MKKSILLVCFIATVIMMAGCEKNEEEGNNDNAYTLPAEYHDMTAAQHLKKITTEYTYYNWDGNNVTMEVTDSIVFVWNGNQVSSVHDYHYSISDIDDQVFLNEDITYTCTYEKNRIVSLHIIDKIYWFDDGGDLQSDVQEWDTPFSYTGMYLTEMGDVKLYYNDSSDVIDFKYPRNGEWVSPYKDPVWQNRNLTEITYVDLNDGSLWTYNCTYDDKISVYRCIPRELAIYLYNGVSPRLSRNNVVREDNGHPYIFEYDGDYPIMRTMEHLDIEDNVVSKDVTHYVYE